MSLFFDVWTAKGFVLASDVLLLRDGQREYLHKIKCYRPGSPVPSAIAVCGDYPEVALSAFSESVPVQTGLRKIAHHVGVKWTNRFAGTRDYSVVHLVGFETGQPEVQMVPQMWFWFSWLPDVGYLSEENLKRQLETFADPIPHNNHIPSKIPELCSHSSLAEEGHGVLEYLSRGPWFTWNGDLAFWQSARETVQAVAPLFGEKLRGWKIERIADLTEVCLRFLIELGAMLPDPTVALSPEQECDVVIVTPEGSRWHKCAKLPVQHEG